MTLSDHPSSPPRRFQFTVRLLLIVQAFIAVLLAWWADHRNQLDRIAALEKQVAVLKGPHLLGHFPQREPEVIRTGPNAFAAFRDGSKIVCANGRHAELWEMTTGQKVFSMEHPELVLDVSISPDEQTLLTVTAGEDAPAYLWNLQDGRVLREYSSPFNSGTQAAPAQWRELFTTYRSQTGFGFTAVAFSPTGRQFATGCEDGTLIVWDTKTAKEIVRMAGKVHRIRAMAFSPDATKIVTSSEDLTVQLWDVARKTLLREVKDSRRPGNSNRHTPVAFSPDATAFAFYNFAGWTESVRDGPGGRERQQDVVGRRIFICDAETGNRLKGLRYMNSPPRGIAFLAQGQTLLSHSSNKLTLWDVASGKELCSHTCAWTRGLLYVEYLSAISSVMAVHVENDENTMHEDWTTIAIVPLSSFQELPGEP